MLVTSSVLPLFKLEECREPPPAMERGAIPATYEFYELQEKFSRRTFYGDERVNTEVAHRAEEASEASTMRRRRRKILPLMRYRPCPKVRQTRRDTTPTQATQPKTEELPRPSRHEVCDYPALHGGASGFKTLGDGFGAANDVASWMRKYGGGGVPHTQETRAVKPVTSFTMTTQPEDESAAAKPSEWQVLSTDRPRPKQKDTLQPIEPVRTRREDVQQRAKLARASRDRQLAERNAFLDAEVRKVVATPAALEIEKRMRYIGAQPKPSRHARARLAKSQHTESEPHLRQHRRLMDKYRSSLLPDSQAVLVARFNELSKDPPAWRSGDTCLCLDLENKAYFPGKVANVHGESVDIVFDNGIERTNVPFSDLKRRQESTDETDAAKQHIGSSIPTIPEDRLKQGTDQIAGLEFPSSCLSSPSRAHSDALTIAAFGASTTGQSTDETRIVNDLSAGPEKPPSRQLSAGSVSTSRGDSDNYEDAEFEDDDQPLSRRSALSEAAENEPNSATIVESNEQLSQKVVAEEDAMIPGDEVPNPGRKASACSVLPAESTSAVRIDQCDNECGDTEDDEDYSENDFEDDD